MVQMGHKTHQDVQKRMQLAMEAGKKWQHPYWIPEVRLCRSQYRNESSASFLVCVSSLHQQDSHWNNIWPKRFAKQSSFKTPKMYTHCPKKQLLKSSKMWPPYWDFKVGQPLLGKTSKSISCSLHFGILRNKTKMATK
jgi:hypothetical protein